MITIAFGITPEFGGFALFVGHLHFPDGRCCYGAQITIGPLHTILGWSPGADVMGHS